MRLFGIDVNLSLGRESALSLRWGWLSHRASRPRFGEIMPPGINLTRWIDGLGQVGRPRIFDIARLLPAGVAYSNSRESGGVNRWPRSGCLRVEARLGDVGRWASGKTVIFGSRCCATLCLSGDEHSLFRRHDMNYWYVMSIIIGFVSNADASKSAFSVKMSLFLVILIVIHWKNGHHAFDRYSPRRKQSSRRRGASGPASDFDADRCSPVEPRASRCAGQKGRVADLASAVCASESCRRGGAKGIGQSRPAHGSPSTRFFGCPSS